MLMSPVKTTMTQPERGNRTSAMSRGVIKLNACASYRMTRKSQVPSVANMLHDLYYWSLGVVQATFWECVMMRLWATGVSPYMTNEEV
tara:strand:- start:183 stop:446 length:264 start_codon:yes stop_codon:yes gene_type:complete